MNNIYIVNINKIYNKYYINYKIFNNYKIYIYSKY